MAIQLNKISVTQTVCVRKWEISHKWLTCLRGPVLHVGDVLCVSDCFRHKRIGKVILIITYIFTAWSITVVLVSLPNQYLFHQRTITFFLTCVLNIKLNCLLFIKQTEDVWWGNGTKSKSVINSHQLYKTNNKKTKNIFAAAQFIAFSWTFYFERYCNPFAAIMFVYKPLCKHKRCFLLNKTELMSQCCECQIIIPKPPSFFVA